MSNIKVYKYGALPPSADGTIREQMRLAREYYNTLIDAENIRRRAIWNAEKCPLPPEHEHPEKGKCSVCTEHYKPIRDKYFDTPPVDIKPLRAIAIGQGLYWGTYLMAEESFAASWKKTGFIYSLKYRSWRQGGVMGVQIQKVSIPSSRFKVISISDPRRGRRSGQRQAIKVRIGTDDKNIPIWSDPICIEMHRPFEGLPTWVKICLKYIGDREIWNVNITCDDVPNTVDRATEGCVAIDVGWRVMPDDTIRLAYAHGSDGIDTDLRLSPKWRECGDRADRIRSERDRRLNELKAKDNRFSKLKHASSVIRVIKRDNISDTDLIEWSKRDRHLDQYEDGCRRRTTAARRAELCVWLCKLRKQYKTAIIKNSSHKAMKCHKKAIADGMFPTARRNGHLCAPGEIIEEICNSFGRADNVAVVKAENTTALCSKCGSLLEVGPELMVLCERCNDSLDRDYVSTRNIMSIYLDGNHGKPTARKTIARFAKRHKVSQPAETMPAQRL